MKTAVLKAAEKKFLKKYPGGFMHPIMQEIGKKHKMNQLTTMVKEDFAEANFDNPDFIVNAMVKIVSRSSMVSVFEKPRFKRMANVLDKASRNKLVKALYELLHGNEQEGFELLVSLLEKKQLAKWTLVTVVQAYYKPNQEIFIKPTTTKLVIDKLGLDLQYTPKPYWDFYKNYRKSIKAMKAKVDKSLKPNNPAFCGFLMMSLDDEV